MHRMQTYCALNDAHVLLNVVIAILMDGYATVKETTSSAVQANINKNVGPILGLIIASNKLWWTGHWNRLRRQPPSEKSRLWSDSQWLCALKVVAKQRALSGRASVLRVSELCHDLRSVPSLADGEDVVWQILNKFQFRYYLAPTDITNPFSEPDVEAHVKEVIWLSKELKLQLTEQDHHSKDLADQLHEQGQHISLLLRLVDNMADVASNVQDLRSNVQDLRDELCKQQTSPARAIKEASAVVVPRMPPATPTRVATREAAATKAAEGTADAKTEAAATKEAEGTAGAMCAKAAPVSVGNNAGSRALSSSEEEVNGVSSYRVRGGMYTPQFNQTRPATAGGDDKPAPPCPAPPTVGGGGDAAQPTHQADVERNLTV